MPVGAFFAYAVVAGRSPGAREPLDRVGGAGTGCFRWDAAWRGGDHRWAIMAKSISSSSTVTGCWWTANRS
ncbi:hypothetical protein D0Q02_17410 [Micromonospora craniellae]|uniref:Uncharacterized protein n=1 Tax=Micromonospora craniellae TaxID=2294034 RepID=A0A372FX93_9ACTN|nr:hypothetical protein D0Q02_17410 [Micromonospora craniellae]